MSFLDCSVVRYFSTVYKTLANFPVAILQYFIEFLHHNENAHSLYIYEDGLIYIRMQIH